MPLAGAITSSACKLLSAIMYECLRGASDDSVCASRTATIATTYAKALDLTPELALEAESVQCVFENGSQWSLDEHTPRLPWSIDLENALAVRVPHCR
jgi:hypothetical protein